MTETMQVERARACDFEELMTMIASCFRVYDPRYAPFDAKFPDLYSSAEEDASNNFIVRDQGRIVSCVGLFPIAVDLCGHVVEIGGIGGVSTLPEYRGRNLMQQLLDKAHEAMVEREYPLGWLAGDRRRYSPWGYELGSQSCKFHLSKRGPGADKYLGKLPGPIREGRVDDFDWSILWNQLQGDPILTACGREKLRRKYGRLHRKLYLVEGDHGGHVLVCETANDRAVHAFGGDPQTVGAILAEKLNADWDAAWVSLPPFPTPLTEVFDDLMRWHEIMTYGSFAILDLAKTLTLFQPHFNQRVADLGLKGMVKIVMGPARQIPRQEVILEADARAFHVAQVNGRSVIDPTVELTCQQMVELLFTSRSREWLHRLPPAARWLAALMPAPVFIPHIYTV